MNQSVVKLPKKPVEPEKKEIKKAVETGSG